MIILILKISIKKVVVIIFVILLGILLIKKE